MVLDGRSARASSDGRIARARDDSLWGEGRGRCKRSAAPAWLTRAFPAASELLSPGYGMRPRPEGGRGRSSIPRVVSGASATDPGRGTAKEPFSPGSFFGTWIPARARFARAVLEVLAGFSPFSPAHRTPHKIRPEALGGWCLSRSSKP